MTDLECRRFTAPIEVRSAPGGRIVLSGVVIRYGARSKDLGGFRERIAAGAASGVLATSDVLALEEHRSERYLGRTGNASLRLFDSRTELSYEVDLPDTATGREVATLAERGDYKGSSFGFRKRSDAWTKSPDGVALRTVTGFALLRDVGPTVSPAYDDTSAEATYRSLLLDASTPLEVRNTLRRLVGMDGMTPRAPGTPDPRVVHRHPKYY